MHFVPDLQSANMCCAVEAFVIVACPEVNVTYVLVKLFLSLVMQAING
jgi:hypothetical protein